MSTKILIAAFALGFAFVVSAADAPAPAPASTNAPAAAVTNTTTNKVHSGCRPKRPGKHGGGVEMKHNCCRKTTEEAPKK